MNEITQVEVKGWKGWYFEHEYLCSPNGDRFSPYCIMACFFWKQLSEVSSLMKAESRQQDELLVFKSNHLDGKWVPASDLQAGRDEGRRTLAGTQRHLAPACAPSTGSVVLADETVELPALRFLV